MSLLKSIQPTARLVCAVVFLCGLIALVPVARAQGAPPIAPAKGEARGLNAEIETILQDMLAAYRNVKSYRDSGRLSVRQVSGRITQVTKMPSRTQLRRPNKLHVFGGIQSISSDGEELQIVLDNIRQYQQGPTPAKLTMEHVRYGAPGAGLDEGYPEILEFLLGQNVYARWISQIDQIKLGAHDPPRKINDREVHAIYYETVHRALISMWIDKETKLLARFDIDNTQAQRAAGAPLPRPGETIPTMEVALQLDPVVINQPESEDGIPSPFALRVLPGMKQVEQFDAGEGPGEAPPPPGGVRGPVHALMGKPVPEILAADLNGKTLDSSQLLARKPSVIFFWTPVGDPGSLASLQMMERLVVRFREKGVDLSILSVSAPGRDAAFVKDLLKAKKATYHALIDQDGRFMRSYSVAVMPAFFLISPDGVIREVHEGPAHEVEPKIIKFFEGLGRSKKKDAATSSPQ